MEQYMDQIRMACDGPSALPQDQLLDPDAMWVRASGWTPLEMLTNCYRNPWQRMSDRIAAARAVLDYAHKKLPAELKLSGNPAAPILGGVKLDVQALGKLNDQELDLLTSLVDKLGGFKHGTPS